MQQSPDPQAAIGRAVRKRREEVGLSQTDLGLEAGLKQSWVSHIELGRGNPSYGTLDRIARALGWPMWQLSRLADELESDDRRPTDQPLNEKP
jgi:transcriptional regulator with XRE-family HTH domain